MVRYYTLKNSIIDHPHCMQYKKKQMVIALCTTWLDMCTVTFRSFPLVLHTVAQALLHTTHCSAWRAGWLRTAETALANCRHSGCHYLCIVGIVEFYGCKNNQTKIFVSYKIFFNLIQFLYFVLISFFLQIFKTTTGMT